MQGPTRWLRDRDLRDRLLFTVMAGALAGAAAALTSRLAELIWVRLTHRAPPEKLLPALPVGRKAGQALASRLLR